MRVTTLVPALSIALSACEPCAGLVGCTVAPHAAVTGQILDDGSGRPVAGVVVDLIRTGGVLLERDSIRTKTDAMGLFGFDVGAERDGETVVTMVVRPPSGTSYRANGVVLQTTNRAAEARVMPPWSTVPHLPDYVEIHRRGAPGEALPGVEFEFKRTGGVDFQNLPSGVFRSAANASALAPMFGDAVRPSDAGVMVGDLTVFLPDPPGPSTYRGYRVTATPEFRYPARIYRLGAGPNLDYWVPVMNRGKPGTYVSGVRLDFQRTSGIEIDPPSWSQVSDAGGSVLFPARALQYGTVTGNVTVTPPAPWKSYTRTISLATFETDSTPFGPVIGVGPGFQYYAIVRASGVPLKGVEVSFQRTSGISITPSPFTVVSNDSGMVFLTPEPQGEGEVVGDITVRPPAPHATFVVRNVRMQAIEGDVPGGRILIGDWDVTAPPAARVHP